MYYSTRKEAEQEAKKMITKLGKGWKKQIWGNDEEDQWSVGVKSLHSHFCIFSDGGIYYSFADSIAPLGGNQDYTDSFQSTDPVKVAKHQLNLLRRHVKRETAFLQKMEKLLGE